MGDQALQCAGRCPARLPHLVYLAPLAIPLVCWPGRGGRELAAGAVDVARRHQQGPPQPGDEQGSLRLQRAAPGRLLPGQRAGHSAQSARQRAEAAKPVLDVPCCQSLWHPALGPQEDVRGFSIGLEDVPVGRLAAASIGLCPAVEAADARRHCRAGQGREDRVWHGTCGGRGLLPAVNGSLPMRGRGPSLAAPQAQQLLRAAAPARTSMPCWARPGTPDARAALRPSCSSKL